MNKRAKVWIYAIISVLAILGLIVALVLIPKDDEPDFDNESNDSPTEVYATNFQINLPTTIEIPVGQSVKILDGFVSVSPASVLNKLTYELSSNSGITFSNNVITANEVGYYSLKFKMPKSQSAYFVKTISIVVSQNYDNAHASIINNSIEKGKAQNIYEIFDIENGFSFNMTSDNKVNISGDTLTGLTVGSSEINLSFVDGYLEYIYSFSIIVKEQPEYQIKLNNVSNNLIIIDISENDVYLINYEVLDKNNQHVTQQILAQSSNNEIVVVEKVYDDSIIKIRAIKSGEAKIVLSILNNLSITVEINIIVE